jgi:tricorn protease
LFRARGIGPLVGTKTWGGLVGIRDVPNLIDGGFITSPRSGFYTLEGEWAIENEGVAPDVKVEMTPKLVPPGMIRSSKRPFESLWSVWRPKVWKSWPNHRTRSGHSGLKATDSGLRTKFGPRRVGAVGSVHH